MSENGNRRRRRHFSRNKEKSPPEPKIEREAPPCGVCGKPIKDILAALLHQGTGEPAHFDCIAKELLAAETLAEGEKFSYLGSGVFGIVRQGKSGDPSSIVIRKKIQYEDKEKAAIWRRSLSIKV
ncbi:MAG: hypothetical protein LBT68_00320 [Spirochaetales bacterium]|jgi:hypothetical protein|nr:hypothetical protein [Spirochaetales bacterium]